MVRKAKTRKSKAAMKDLPVSDAKEVKGGGDPTTRLGVNDSRYLDTLSNIMKSQAQTSSTIIGNIK